MKSSERPRPTLDGRHQQYEENLVYERFVSGELSADDREAFEDHFVTCDVCLDQLEVTERLQAALRGVAVEEGAQAQVAMAVAWWRRWTYWSRAGGVALMLLAGVALWRLDADRDALRAQLDRASTPPAKTFLVSLDVVRGAADAEPLQLDFSDTPEWIVLALEAPAASELFRWSLADADGVVIWQQGGVQADGAGQLLVGLPSELLQSPRYTLAVIAEDGRGEQQFELVIRR